MTTYSTKNRVTKCSALELMIGKIASPFGVVPDDNVDEIYLDQLREQAVTAMKKNSVVDKARFDNEKAKVKSN